MATTHETERAGTVVQSWLPHPLDKQLREHAGAERRSLSSTVRIAVEDKLRRGPGAEVPRPSRSPASPLGEGPELDTPIHMTAA